SGLKWNICLVYLDDIIVFSKSFNEHLNHLQLVFNRIQSAGLKLKTNKCHFCRNKLNYLGYQITPDGISPDTQKTLAIDQFPVPTKVKAVMQFLGLAGYYRRFIKNFSDIARPLYNLLHNGVKFRWDS